MREEPKRSRPHFRPEESAGFRPDHSFKTGYRKVYWWSVFPLFSLLPLPAAAILKLHPGKAWWLVLGLVVFVNFGTALLYYFDKLCAETGRWRVGERTLQLAALCGGWGGAFIAQQVLRHKVAKPSFQFVFWGIVFTHQIILLEFIRGFVWWRALTGS